MLARNRLTGTVLPAGIACLGVTLMLAGCGSSASSSATPSVAQLAGFVACLRGHGVSIAKGAGSAQIDSVLTTLPKTQRHADIVACRSSLDPSARKEMRVLRHD